MSLSKKEYYSDFLYGLNNNLVKWVLLPIENFKKEESSQSEEDTSVAREVELEVMFNYNKKSGVIKLTGVQISSVLGYPSSSLVFNNKDIIGITKTNSTYQFTVKSSPYTWEITLSGKGIITEKEYEDEGSGDIKTNKLISSNKNNYRTK
jgi:hypothetical protein